MGARGSSEFLRDKVLHQFDMPAARNGCYSAREIYRRVKVVRTMRAELSAAEAKAIETELPRGLLGGLEDFVDRTDAAVSRAADNHPKRLKLLDRLAGLPFLLHKDLMALNGRLALIRQQHLGDLGW